MGKNIKSAWGYFKKKSFYHWLLIIAIVVNVVQFPTIRDHGGELWGSLYILNDQNIFVDDYGRRDGPSSFNIWVELGQSSPESSLLIASEAHPFKKGLATRFKAMSAGRVKSIEKSKISTDGVNTDKLNENLSSSGEYWLGSLHKRSGEPPIKWSIYLKDNQAANKIIFTENELDDETVNWTFIDKDLLPHNAHKGTID